MSPFRMDLKRLFAEDDRLAADAEQFLAMRMRSKSLVTKKVATEDIVRKTVASNKTRGTDFVLSTAAPDRYNDIILSDGWELDNFRKNPVALFAHMSSFVVGTWKNVRVEDNALQGTLVLAKEGTSDRIDEIRRLVDAGILKAVSVGFTPIEYEERKGDEYGILYKKQELMECSLVSVPANPAALVVAKKLNISADTQDLVFASQHRLPALLAGPMDAASDAAWNQWADRKISRALNKLVADINEHNKIERKLTRQGMSQAIADLRKDFEIAVLKREISELKGKDK